METDLEYKKIRTFVKNFHNLLGMPSKDLVESGWFVIAIKLINLKIKSQIKSKSNQKFWLCHCFE